MVVVSTQSQPKVPFVVPVYIKKQIAIASVCKMQTENSGTLCRQAGVDSAEQFEPTSDIVDEPSDRHASTTMADIESARRAWSYSTLSTIHCTCNASWQRNAHEVKYYIAVMLCRRYFSRWAGRDSISLFDMSPALQCCLGAFTVMTIA